MIRSRFPDHSIVGEEYGETIGNERYQWIIDPIDGTKSFVRGVPLYTTLVALAIDGEPVVGVIYCPPTGESVAAATGFGAWNERGDRVSTRKTFALQEAWTLITDPSDFVRREGEWAAALIRESASVRTWADAYGYMLVARGDADVMIDPVMSAWDIAPLGVIVRESGGLFTELDGSNTAIGGSALAAGTHELHETVLQMRRATEDER
jgi:histidinol phosphatase-like enzyme (inositol monophosphatase family)